MTPAEARQNLGLSREEMAAAMGVHYETWAKWERGQRQPDRAAVRLMEMMCWLHEHRAPTLAQWLREI
jgi:DNA-binding transcriptional regulator YiaG